MAKVIGSVPADKWEREVINQMRVQLPSNWVVIQNIQWSLSNGKYVRDGQCDIVVLIPKLGLVVVEVKGTNKIKVDHDGKWYRLERNVWVVIDEPPPHQANRNLHSIIQIINHNLHLNNFPGIYAFLVAYPNGTIESCSGMYDHSTIISQVMMNQLQSRLRNALTARDTENAGQNFDDKVLINVSEILTEQNFSVARCDTNLDVNEDLVNVDTLTTQQFSALKGVFDFPRVAVAGPAGSGKTLLAIWRLQALLDSGKRVIYVCFNKKLASVLKNKYKDCAAQIFNVDALFSSIVPGCKPSGNLDKYFRENLPDLVLTAKESIRQNDLYDAILVDEGQDFSEDQLIALYELLKSDNAQWNLFADYNQDLYHLESNEFIGCEVVFKLSHNCRNTMKVNSATNGYMASHVLPMPGIPEGVVPVVHYCAGKSTMASKAWELAQQWQNSDGVVILSPYTLKLSSMADFPKGHGFELTEDLNMLGDKKYVCFSTIKGFKGIEAGAVIFIDADIPVDKSALQKEDVYVACTRPRTRLAVLCTNQEALKFYGSTSDD